MNKYVERTFIRVFKFYKKWGEVDVFFTTAFALSTLPCFLLTFLIGLGYYLTGWELLFFNFWPIGVIVATNLGLSYWYFAKNKAHLLFKVKNFNEPFEAVDWLILSILASMWLLGCFSAFLFRWRYLGY